MNVTAVTMVTKITDLYEWKLSELNSEDFTTHFTNLLWQMLFHIIF